MRSPRLVALLPAVAVGALLAASLFGSALAQSQAAVRLPAGRLTPQERRGKQIYLRGVSPSGKEITAFLGDSSTSVPATAMTCVNCHGFDGRGRPEGGVIPSDITWEALTKTYGVTHASGRKHPPYDERTLSRSITDGLDPASQKLPASMPTYWMPREDLSDLIAYMKRLGKEADPGLAETSIKIGTILPTTGPPAEMGQAMKAIIAAYFDEINSQGGVYNRKLELSVGESANTPAATRASAERLIKEQQVFALTGAFMAGADKEVASLLEAEEVPLVGPQTLLPQVGFPLNRYVFYLFSGLKEQSCALMKFAAQKLPIKSPRIAIVYPEGEMIAGIVGGLEEQSKRSRFAAVRKIKYSAARFEVGQLVREAKQENFDVILFLGDADDRAALLKESDSQGWTPRILIPGSLAGKEIFDAPASFNGRIFLSFPTLPSDQSVEGVAEYRALAEKSKLPARHLAAQLSAYCAAKILVEGLKRAGKDLSREKLIATLEGLYEFDTGLTPRITYGPNRRLGALGAYILSVDSEKKAFIPASEWVTPD